MDNLINDTSTSSYSTGVNANDAGLRSVRNAMKEAAIAMAETMTCKGGNELCDNERQRGCNRRANNNDNVRCK